MKTAKEKADELIQKFGNVELLQDVGGMDIELAKQCALVACEEVTSQVYSVYLKSAGDESAREKFLLWKRIKEELEKM